MALMASGVARCGALGLGAMSGALLPLLWRMVQVNGVRIGSSRITSKTGEDYRGQLPITLSGHGRCQDSRPKWRSRWG